MMWQVFRSLDEWVAAENTVAMDRGTLLLAACKIRVLGQTALWEAGLGLELAVTRDVDVYADYAWPVQQRFEQLLAAQGRILDPVGDEAWMPGETVYRSLYEGRYVAGRIAEPDFVLISKALKAPSKNAPILTAYLAAGPSERFMALAKRYGVDLEQFL